MLSAVGSKARFEDCVNRVQWPSHIGRLPKNVSFVLVFVSWKSLQTVVYS